MADLTAAAVEKARTAIDLGAEVVVGLSGGKDSSATSLLLHTLGIPHRRLYLDTTVLDSTAGPGLGLFAVWLLRDAGDRWLDRSVSPPKTTPRATREPPSALP